MDIKKEEDTRRSAHVATRSQVNFKLEKMESAAMSTGEKSPINSIRIIQENKKTDNISEI